MSQKMLQKEKCVHCDLPFEKGENVNVLMGQLKICDGCRFKMDTQAVIIIDKIEHGDL